MLQAQQHTVIMTTVYNTVSLEAEKRKDIVFVLLTFLIHIFYPFHLFPWIQITSWWPLAQYSFAPINLLWVGTGKCITFYTVQAQQYS